jgi:hypothetical protein
MKGVYGTIEVVTNQYVVGKMWEEYTDGGHKSREAHMIYGVFNNVDEAISCLGEHLPKHVSEYIDAQFFVHKERFDKAVAIYPEMETMVEKRELGADAYEIEYRRWHEMPILTPEQRIQLADITGYTFATWDDSSKYYINRTALVPVEVIK